MKDCPDIRWELSAYLDGELTPPQRAEVEAHLASCPGCRQELSELKTLGLGVAALAKLQHAPRFLYAVRSKIPRGAKPEPMTWQDYIFRPYWFKIPLEVAALIVICLMMRGERPVPTGKDTRLTMIKGEGDNRGRVAANSRETAFGARTVNEQSFEVAKEAVPAEVDSVGQNAQAPKDGALSSPGGGEVKTFMIQGSSDQRQLLDKSTISGDIAPRTEEKSAVGARRIPAMPSGEPASPSLAPLSAGARVLQSIATTRSKLGETLVLHARDFNEVRDRTQQLALRCQGRIVGAADSTVFVELPKEYVAAFKLELLKAPEASAASAKVNGGVNREQGPTNGTVPGAAVGMGSGSGVLTGEAGTNTFVNGLVPLGLRDETADAVSTTVLEIRVLPPSN